MGDENNGFVFPLFMWDCITLLTFFGRSNFVFFSINIIEVFEFK